VLTTDLAIDFSFYAAVVFGGHPVFDRLFSCMYLLSSTSTPVFDELFVWFGGSEDDADHTWAREGGLVPPGQNLNVTSI